MMGAINIRFASSQYVFRNRLAQAFRDLIGRSRDRLRRPIRARAFWSTLEREGANHYDTKSLYQNCSLSYEMGTQR